MLRKKKFKNMISNIATTKKYFLKLFNAKNVKG